jgi:hypothetical protein
LKGALLTRPVLELPVAGRKWRLATDASHIAFGAVLSQINEQGEEHPIGFYSKKLTPAERKWDIWELELAAMVWATTLCRHYLRGDRFELITDSKVVAMLLKKEVPTRRENLVVRLAEFDFDITHRKAELNRNADFFSRWAAYKDWEEERAVKAYCISFFPMTEEENEDIESVRKKIVEEQRKDPKLLKLIQALECEERKEASADAAVEHKQGERRDLVDIAMQDDSTSLFKLIGNDKVLVKAVSFRRTRASDFVTYWPIVVPDSLVPAVLSVFHGDKSPLCHAGKHKTYGAIRTRFTWRGLVNSIRQWLGACHKCLRRKRVVPKHQTYNVHQVSLAPMNRIAIDMVGPFPKTKKGNTHIHHLRPVLTLAMRLCHWVYDCRNGY